jgi:uncharacterized protein (DUF2237 family)
MSRKSKNIKGNPLKLCSQNPLTGFYRDGYCHTGIGDTGTHTVCAKMTDDFLKYTKKKGNNLSEPSLDNNFPGLIPGDKWCLCASRWNEAYNLGKAPPVILEATNQATIRYVPSQKLFKSKHR